MIEPWDRLASEAGGDYRIFRVRRDRSRSRASGGVGLFSVIEAPDWVNVWAVTDDGRVVLIRQFRHGTRDVSLEIPGGAVDPGEAPEAAARRELAEETGYTAARWTHLGTVAPNPAIQANRCHTFLAAGARPTGTTNLGPGEEIEVVLATAAEVRERVRSGEIDHALVVAALWYWDHASVPAETRAPARSGLVGVDHVQLAMPAGGEDRARAFYGALLGMDEVPKPAELASRGGCWFTAPGVALHLGVEGDFRAARKAHPGLLVADVDALAQRLASAGVVPRWDDAIPGTRRFFVDDPFGNRLELIAAR